MTTTTSYGTWLTHTAGTGGGLTLRAGIEAALGESVAEFDVDAIERDCRTRIAERLPDGVRLVGDEFYGLAPEPDHAREGIRDAIHSLEGEPFWAIVERHDKADAAKLAAAADELTALGQEMNPEGYR